MNNEKLKIALFISFMMATFFAGNFFMSIMCSIFAFVILSLEASKQNTIIKSIRNTMIAIGVINGLLMILGAFTNFEILRSYAYTHRFGYNGFFIKRTCVIITYGYFHNIY